MTIRTLLLLLVLLALAIFVIANWAAFTAPTTLSLLVGTVQAPLGIVMLAITAALALVFGAYAFWLQTSALLETRRLARELESQRKLAEQAEASRFTELRTALDARLDRLEAQLRASAGPGAAAGAAPLRDDAALRRHIDDAVNGLAAQIAELDDRLSVRPPGSGRA